MSYRRAFAAPGIGKPALLMSLRENEAQPCSRDPRSNPDSPSPARRALVARQIRVLTRGRGGFPRYHAGGEAESIAACLGITPAIASALREQVFFLERPGFSWAARFAEALEPGTDTAGLARAYAERLSDFFESGKLAEGPRAHLAMMVAEASDADVDALPGLLALAAVETTRSAGLSGRGPYLRAYLRAGKLLLDLLKLAAPRAPYCTSPIREMTHV